MDFPSILGAILTAPFVFLPAVRPQTTSAAADEKVVLLAPEKKEASSLSSLAPTALRSTHSKESGLTPVHFHKKQFFILSTAVYTAATADMYQTLHVRHYYWWSETDPLARPLVKLPSPAYYATGFALATGVNWLGWKMGHSRKWHKLATVPQLFAIGGNTYGFKSNHYQGY